MKWIVAYSDEDKSVWAATTVRFAPDLFDAPTRTRDDVSANIDTQLGLELKRIVLSENRDFVD